ncbi:fertility inhibition FinO-like protein [Acaryochloris marina]|uniref:fertility inhibition FinO-like protein n=1 Tax=Acaryochloris marina TaxID=155978 RepID=UPI001BB0B9D9|nr:fertility inhibition FinO-like protein [Acaryochloris marina]QUY40415.1 fertility inhibition FinO-like protein [Acaryochloris marina S15]
MATTAHIQITCKISEVPKSKAVNGLVEFYLTENNQAVMVRVKPKQFKQLTDHQFEYWTASIVGKLGPVNERGFELLNSGIQVYSRKPKAGEVPNHQTHQTSNAKKKLTEGVHFG